MLFFIILFIVSILSGLFLPWWSIAIFSFVLAYFLKEQVKAPFWSGFLAIFLSWILLALIKSLPNQNILATRMAKLFHLPNWTLLLLLTGLIGGLIGGVFSLSGFWLKKDLRK